MVETGGESAATGRRCILAAAALWSLAGAVAKGLDLDPTAIAFYRSLFAGLALLPWVPRRRRGLAPAMIPLGVLFGAMTGLYIGSIKATTAANAIFLQCTASVWTIPLSLFWLGERPDRRAVAGIGLATFGVAAIVLFSHDPGRPTEPFGIALGLASGVGFAAVMVMLRALRDHDPTWLSAVGNLGGSITLGAWLVASTGSIPVPSVSQFAVLIAFGVVQMAIPYVLFARGLRSIGAPEASLIALLEPILNPVWVVLFVGEAPAPATVIGGLFLLAGVAIRYIPGPAGKSDLR